MLGVKIYDYETMAVVKAVTVVGIDEAREVVKRELKDVRVKYTLRTWQRRNGIERYVGRSDGKLLEAVIWKGGVR